MEKKSKDIVGRTKRGTTRGTPEQGAAMYNRNQEQMKEFNEHMKYIEEQLSDNRGKMKGNK